MKLEELEKRILKENPRAVRLEKTKKARKESLHDFLVKFFTTWNNEKSTVYVDTKEVQTGIKKRRSLGDIFMICKYYYPKVTLAEVIQELYVDLKAHFEKGFRTSYCHTIHKRVWYYNESMPHLQYEKTTKDEYGNTWRVYMTALKKEEIELEEDEQEEVCPDCGELIEDCECDN